MIRTLLVFLLANAGFASLGSHLAAEGEAMPCRARLSLEKGNRIVGFPDPRIDGPRKGTIYILGGAKLERYGQTRRDLWESSNAWTKRQHLAFEIDDYHFDAPPERQRIRRYYVHLLVPAGPEEEGYILPAGRYRWWIQYFEEAPKEESLDQLVPCVAESEWFEVHEDFRFDHVYGVVPDRANTNEKTPRTYRW